MSMTLCHRLAFVSRRLLLAVLMLIAFHSLRVVTLAQSSTATLSGTVTDPNNAVVPGAHVTATNNGTGLKREATTSGSGTFTIPLLPPSTYTVLIENQGFTPAQINDVVLNVGDNVALNIQLKIGQVGATVDVKNEAPLINESGAVGTVVDRQFVENIPLNGRSFQSLITLTPGVVVVPNAVTNTGGQFSVNGQRASANSFMVDGVSANFAGAPGAFGGPQSTGNLPSLTTFGTTQSLVSVDALQEFKVQTSTYSAEFGRQPGGQISIVTRSGANQFHGSLFDYLRNNVFDANDWFANRAGQPRPPERQNDFGGTFSGPVLLPRFGEGGHQPGYDGRNRTFFFFSYEGLRLRLPQFSLTNVPTLALRQQVPPSIQPILNAFPLPNGRDLGSGLAEFSASYSDPSSLDATSVRIDHTIKSKFTVFGRYNKAPSKTSTRQAGINLSTLLLAALNTQTVTLGITSLLTPLATNDLRVNYSSSGARQTRVQDNFGGAAPPPRGALIPSQFDSSTAQGSVRLLGFVGATSSGIPLVGFQGTVTDQRQFNILDNFSYSAGSHQFKFGFDYRKLTPIFNANLYSINALFQSSQQLLAATAGIAGITATQARKPVIVNLSAYAQDRWKLSRRLTLDLGLRWDVNPAPTEANGPNQPAVTQINNLATMDLAPMGTRAWKTTYNNFAPRIGVTYELSQKPGQQMVLRGGFGVFYDAGNDLGGLNDNQTYPFFASRVVSNVSFPLSPVQAAPPLLPIQTGIVPPFGSFNAFNPELKLPYTLQWNFAVERSLGTTQALTVSYVGAAGRRLLQGTQMSLSQINPRFTTITLISNKATSDYHALQANFQRRLSRGLQALVSYTWSHALDDDSTSNGLRVAQRGNADFDVRHVFATAVTYDIPAPAMGQMIDAFLRDWSVDTNIHAQSPLPVDLVASTLIDPLTGSFINVRPNIVAGVPFYVDDPSVPGGRRINRSAFTIPLAGQSGNFGRNQLRGFPAWQVDLAVRREFSLREKLRLQFRAEAFNVFNHPNFGTIQTNLNAANFGQATNMLNRQLGGISQLYQIGGPRSIQFAMKVLF
jgi:hypothetical protein